MIYFFITLKNIKIFACPTAEEFTKEICETLSLPMGEVECYKFANDNNFVQFKYYSYEKQ